MRKERRKDENLVLSLPVMIVELAAEGTLAYAFVAQSCQFHVCAAVQVVTDLGERRLTEDYRQVFVEVDMCAGAIDSLAQAARFQS